MSAELAHLQRIAPVMPPPAIYAMPLLSLRDTSYKWQEKANRQARQEKRKNAKVF